MANIRQIAGSSRCELGLQADLFLDFACDKSSLLRDSTN